MKLRYIFGAIGSLFTLIALALPHAAAAMPAFEYLAYAPTVIFGGLAAIAVTVFLLFGLTRQAALFAIAALYFAYFQAFRKEVSDKLTGRMSLA